MFLIISNTLNAMGKSLKKHGVLIFYILTFLSLCSISLLSILIALIFAVPLSFIFGILFYFHFRPNIEKFTGDLNFTITKGKIATISASFMFVVILTINVAGIFLSPLVLPPYLSIDDNEEEEESPATSSTQPPEITGPTLTTPPQETTTPPPQITTELPTTKKTTPPPHDCGGKDCEVCFHFYNPQLMQN